MKKIPHKSAGNKLRIGVISDTHGSLDAMAIDALRGVDLIIHAGDIDTPEVLAELNRTAPVTAVRGNMDRGRWSAGLSTTEVVEAGESHIYVLHDFQRLALDPIAAGFRAVVCGHTHRPTVQRRNGVVFINPGSAAYPRWGSSPSVAVLDCDAADIQARIIFLEPQHRSLS
jgi:putative phosphoesterase